MSSELISVTTSLISQIQNLTISNVNATALTVQSSEATLINSLTIFNSSQGIKLISSQFHSFENSSITNCGSETLVYGGAMLIKNGNSTILNSIFSENKARKGAAISIQ